MKPLARSNDRFRWGIKGFLSLFILYQITVITVLPNNDSILCRALAPLLTPYANALGFNTTWKFFSPEPSPAIYYVYDVDMMEGGEPVAADTFWRNRGFITGRWPPDHPKNMLKENVRRLVYYSRFVTVTPESTEKFLGNLLCRFYPKAHSVSVRAVLEDIPNVENFNLEPAAFDKVVRERDLAALEFNCRKETP
jgi:hypothetical protein